VKDTARNVDVSVNGDGDVAVSVNGDGDVAVSVKGDGDMAVSVNGDGDGDVIESPTQLQGNRRRRYPEIQPQSVAAAIARGTV
jgi:hypothetical protein